MSKILCLDASTEACSAALLNDGEITERYQLAPRQHAQLLLPMVEQLLNDSSVGLTQLDAIACLQGPGAFTGIRIAVSVAQGLAFGADLPTIGLSSLQNLAQQAFEQSTNTWCFSSIDARMQEVYFAQFNKDQSGIAQLVGEEQVVAPADINFQLLQPKLKSAAIGSGWPLCQPEYLTKMQQHTESSINVIDDIFPRAKASLLQAECFFINKQYTTAADLQPTYLRNNVAIKKSAKK